MFLAIATAFSFSQPVKADQKAPAERPYFEWARHQDSRQHINGVVPVPCGLDITLLGSALLAVAVRGAN
jgi:hypothetical protein